MTCLSYEKDTSFRSFLIHHSVPAFPTSDWITSFDFIFCMTFWNMNIVTKMILLTGVQLHEEYNDNFDVLTS